MMMLAKILFVFLCFTMSFSLHAQHVSVAAKKKATLFSISLPYLEKSPILKQNTLQIEAAGEVEGMHEGKILFKSFVKNKKLQGSWTSFHANGQMLDSGNFIKGIPDGVWKIWDSSGNLLKVRHYDADLFFRIREDIRTKHPRYQKFAITTLYITEGEHTLNYLTADYSFSSHSSFSHPTLESLIQNNMNDIGNYQPVFIACAQDGAFINYTSSGLLIDSGNYRNGLKEGLWIHNDIKKKQTEKGFYKKGKRFDIWKTYDASGKLLLLRNYSDQGKLLWEKERN